MTSVRVRRAMRWLLGGLGLVALFALTLALPVTAWRTGRTPLPPLEFLPPQTRPELPRRVWIDTDAACGHGRRTDVDDCLAMLALARTRSIEIAGISTVFGNAPLAVTDPTTRALVALLDAGGERVPRVHQGRARPLDASGDGPTAASQALAAALRSGPLAIVALGPLTNIADTLREEPQLQARVTAVIAVMGRRRGHLFHPAEGDPDAMLFGHGPVFRDVNFMHDARAAALLLRTSVPLVLVPYDAARRIEIGAADLDALSASSRAGAWVAQRAQGWLAFWRERIGREGFYPFDLMAALYLVAPQRLQCARVQARVGSDALWLLPWHDEALLVSQAPDAPGRPALYCPDAPEEAKRVALALLGTR